MTCFLAPSQHLLYLRVQHYCLAHLASAALPWFVVTGRKCDTISLTVRLTFGRNQIRVLFPCVCNKKASLVCTFDGGGRGGGQHLDLPFKFAD